MKELLGVSINSLENLLMGAAACFLALYLASLLLESKPHWFLSQQLRDCLRIEHDFNKLVESRRDGVHHFYWAKSNNEKKKAREMEQEISRVEGEIEDLREKYKAKARTLSFIVQKLI